MCHSFETVTCHLLQGQLTQSTGLSSGLVDALELGSGERRQGREWKQLPYHGEWNTGNAQTYLGKEGTGMGEPFY